MKTTYLMATLALVAATSAQAQTKAPAPDRATQVMKASFKERGQAKLDRLNQDKAMELCTKYTTTPIPRKLAAEIEAW